MQPEKISNWKLGVAFYGFILSALALVAIVLLIEFEVI